MSNTTDVKEKNETTALIYEVGYHIIPTTSAEEVKQIASAFKTQIGQLSGEVISQEEPARMTLAYEMTKDEAGKKNHYSQSYFGWIKVFFAISSLKALLKILFTTKTKGKNF
jgi:ribosomal protein S6